MITQKLLIESMSSLSLSELNRFDKLLRSPYFKKRHFNNMKIYELFKILKSYFLRFPIQTPKQSPIFNWEKAAKKLFPLLKHEEEKHKHLAKLCSELISYLLEFFAVERFCGREVDFRIAVSEELLKRNLSQTFQRYWKVKYFRGIYSEDEVLNIYHRYELIRLANIHKEKYKEPRPDYELELMLFRKYQSNTVSELIKRAKMSGYKLPMD